MQETPEETCLRQTGEWWADPWWLKENWLEVRPITSEQLHGAFEYLKTIFDQDWVRSYKGELVENIFLRSILYDRTAFTRSYLVTLSERLKRLEKAKGVQAVIRNLRGRQESDAANMELELADIFASEGFHVEFPIAKSSKGKSPDIRLEKGPHRLSVECKNLRVGEQTAWLAGAFNLATSKLFDLTGELGLRIEFKFLSEVGNRLLEYKRSGVHADLAAMNLIKRIEDEIRAAVVRDRWPVWFWIENHGEGFLAKTGTTVGSEIQHPDTPDELLFRRLLGNALIPAAKQLSNEDAPGLIAIHARDIPSEELLRDELNQSLRENRDNYSHILAVLVLPWQGWFRRDRPLLVVNHHGRFSWENSNVESMLSRLDPVIL